MAVRALAAAKKLCELSDWSLTNLQLNKMLYIAHMIALGRDKHELISDSFEAWDYGPVLPNLYHKAKSFGSAPVKNVFHSVREIDDGYEEELLEEAYEHLSTKSPGELVAMTHWNGGAWANCYSPGRNVRISNDEILREYRNRADAR